MERKHWSFNDSVCELCGYEFNLITKIAEMYEPDSDDGSIICHVQCGKNNNLIIERMVHPVGSH